MVTETLERESLEFTPDRHEAILICLLGSFRLLRRGEPLDLLLAGKALTLISELALHLDAGVPREELLETLWPEQDTVLSAVSLNSLVYSLQRRLRHNPQAASAVIHINGSYFLNQDAGYSTDIARFDTLIAAGNQLVAGGADVDAVPRYECAVALYRGDLCTGTDVYAVIERERLRASYLTALAWLAAHAYAQGHCEAALKHALKLLAADPCREDAHRIVMRARVHRHERAQALRQYRLCEHVLRREFDAAPETQTTDLFNRIRLDPASI
jgi:DNA-binding SARP family transcriptional activator